MPKTFRLLIATLVVAGSLLAQPTTLLTTFAAGNGQSGNMFDLDVTSTVLLESFDIHLSTGVISDVEVYACETSLVGPAIPTSYVGNEANPSAWTLIGSATGIAGAGQGLPTPLGLNLNYLLEPGTTYGFYVTSSTGSTINYTNGTAAGALFATDGIMNFYEGVGVVYAFGGTFTPRVFNGQIRYIVGDPVYQTNRASASLDIDGVVSNGFAPAISTIATCSSGVLSFASNVMGTAYDLAVSGTALVPAMTPGTLTTTGGQIVNIDLSSPASFFLNGGPLPAFLPFPGSVMIPLSSTVPLTLSVQMVVLDPASADLIALSQGAQWDASVVVPASGPTTDDGTLLVDLNTLCGPINVFGATHSLIGVNANGRVTLSSIDSDFSPTVGEAQADAPFVGFWTDLNPALGGAIEISDANGVLSVTWSGVPYISEPGTSNSFGVQFDRVGGTVSLTNLTGIGMNPASSVGSGDAIFLGLSKGYGGSGGFSLDAGPTTFTSGGVGVQTQSNDMLYDFVSGSPVGVPFLTSSLLPGTLDRIDFFAVGGLVNWIGF